MAEGELPDEQLNVGDHRLLIDAFAASAKEFRTFLPVVNQVLDSMQIELVS